MNDFRLKNNKNYPSLLNGQQKKETWMFFNGSYLRIKLLLTSILEQIDQHVKLT